MEIVDKAAYSKTEVQVEFRDVTFYNKEADCCFCHVDFILKQSEIAFFTDWSNEQMGSFFLVLLGFVPPTCGEVFCFEKAVPYHSKEHLLRLRRNIGFVHSQNGLLKNLTVKENIMLPMQIKGRFHDEEMDQRVNELVQILGIRSSMDTEAWRVGKFEEKKILLARAVCAYPDLLLINNPTGLLELKYMEEITELINDKIVRKKVIPKHTAVIITTEYPDWSTGTILELTMCQKIKLNQYVRNGGGINDGV